MTGLVTVFGGSGFVGKPVVRALTQKGWRVRVAVRKAAEAYDLKPLGDVGQVQVVRCDVRVDEDVARALEGASAVVNLVGILYETLSLKFEALHHQASAIIARLAAERGITSFVQVSAIGADAQATSKYLSTKGLGEDAVRAAIPDAVILRPSVVFGPQDGFLTGLANQAKLFPLLPSIGGGNTQFQPVFVGDVARAVAETLGHADSLGQTFELGGPEVFSFNDLVRYVGEETHTPRPLVWTPYSVAGIIGFVGNIHAGLHGMIPVIPAPLLTTDQVEMLKTDNVVSAQAKGLKDLGIVATGLESIAPSYLWRFRKNGQFAEVVG
ncbi:MAG: complex I NDUFA9 subunit family protein [Asticcacaulis sp.]